MCNEAFSRGFPKGDWYLFVYFDTCSVKQYGIYKWYA